MEDIEFEEKDFDMVQRPKPKPKGLIGLLIRWGMVKTTSGANIILIIITIVAFSLSALFLVISSQASLETERSYKLMQKIDQTPLSTPAPETPPEDNF